jgi:hypothetical protein
MNHLNQTIAAPRRHPGRLLLLLGVLAALAGLAIYAAQLYANILTAPWYVPILATLGLVLLVAALVRSRSIWRWLALLLITFVVAAEWFALLVLLSLPAYTGPVKAGEPFPAFSTTLADGSNFDQDSLKGDRDTVMVFFRGRW